SATSSTAPRSTASTSARPPPSRCCCCSWCWPCPPSLSAARVPWHDPMADINLINVNKVYPPDVKAVEDVDLHINDGEFMILLGPSGCGKSTTLRMIAGLENITSGDLYLGDHRINDVDPRDRNLAIVFQNYALYPHMTVRANLSFGLRLRHRPGGRGEQGLRERG